MEKDLLEKYINQKMTLKEIQSLTGKCQTTIRHWLKKYDLKTFDSTKEVNKNCIFCSLPTNDGRMLCNLCNVKMNRYRYRIALIKYLGGKCIKCGYDKNISVLEFHHIDAEDKDFTLSAGIKNWEAMKKEADKCELLCSNCHREKHTDDYWVKMTDEYAKMYNGNNEELKSLLQ